MKVKKATLLMVFNYFFLAIIQQSRSLRRKVFSRSQTGLISIFPSFTVSDARHADGAFLRRRISMKCCYEFVGY
jgi:hypothetical protein